VSRPLVDDFRRRYPDKTTATLPNGFDPADFAASGNDSGNTRQATAILAQHVPAGALLIGHFGRIGASDASASKSLDYLVDALNGSIETAADRHLMFVGELTRSERATLERAKFSVSVLAPVERGLALELMKRCDKLLLLTGSRASCATGKLFEYLAAGAPIVCISGVPNEATAILTETGAGQTLLTSDAASGSAALRLALSPAAVNAHRDIDAYSKVAQAGMLDRWISSLVLA
jgi:glycosyltransferase involved in cell wall biosynthesis